MVNIKCKYIEDCKKHQEKHDSFICFNPLIPLTIGCSRYDTESRRLKATIKETKDEDNKLEEVYFFDLKKLAKRFKIHKKEIVLCAENQGYRVLFPCKKRMKTIRKRRGQVK
ncbi:MAG: hypothetical protein ACTSPD_09935 [Promethearchaeota archaeon]